MVIVAPARINEAVSKSENIDPYHVRRNNYSGCGETVARSGFGVAFTVDKSDGSGGGLSSCAHTV
jgi:hypothetical protein